MPRGEGKRRSPGFCAKRIRCLRLEEKMQMVGDLAGVADEIYVLSVERRKDYVVYAHLNGSAVFGTVGPTVCLRFKLLSLRPARGSRFEVVCSGGGDDQCRGSAFNSDRERTPW